jgi:phenylacetate-CoA ligase
MSRLDSIYVRLPTWAQHGAISAYGSYRYWLRFGPGYGRYIKQYKQRERYSSEEWQAWQGERLRNLLRITATSVPYYQRTWTREEKAAALAGRLDDLPLLGKDPIRTDPKAFLRQDMRPRRPVVFHTSGSTGILQDAEGNNWRTYGRTQPRE